MIKLFKSYTKALTAASSDLDTQGFEAEMNQKSYQKISIHWSWLLNIISMAVKRQHYTGPLPQRVYI